MKHIFLLSVSIACNCILMSGYNDEAQWSVDNYYRYNREGYTESAPEKQEFIERYRRHLYDADTYAGGVTGKYSLPDLTALLHDDGRFSDLDDSMVGPNGGNAANSGGAVQEAYNRIWYMAHAVKYGKIGTDSPVWTSMLKAIVHYGNVEISRKNDWTRFHSSCFAIPKAATFSYFLLLPQMDAAESGECQDSLLSEACRMLKIIGLQTWTQPVREDLTDLNVVQVERFRNHVWWVGGNGLGTDGYRCVFPAAVMIRSVAMIDLLAYVARMGISTTSQPTYHTSFWNEGFTADGAGWGHGRQCLIWGYPIHGTSGALEILTALKDSPWQARLSRENVQTLMNYFRGGNFYYYKGYAIPCLDRGSMSYGPTGTIPYAGLLNQVLTYWSDALTPSELEELTQLRKEIPGKDIRMDGYDAYSGSRYFFNNDDLVKKTGDSYIMVNMASSRCDGIESADGFADCYNFYTTDGSTFFEKTGDEYRPVIGGFDVTAFPGVTAREGMDRLVPVTNWRGYNSRHNFAAASAHGGENAVAGYIFEKNNCSDREDVNDKGDNHGMNEVLYGVKAYKSYFILGDYMVALGAGITNLEPEQPGTIRTTIDQTAHEGDVSVWKDRRNEWVVQDGKFAYSVLPQYGHKLNHVCETKYADWAKMNKANIGKKDLPDSVDILRLWIDHGQKPVDDKYGYVVYTGDGKPSGGYPFKVLRNDTTVQAVQSADGSVIEAVFYTPSTLKAGGMKIAVSATCTLLLEKTDGGWLATLTDAEMDTGRSEIVLTINGRQHVIAMPQGALCGSPMTVEIPL